MIMPSSVHIARAGDLESMSPRDRLATARPSDPADSSGGVAESPDSEGGVVCKDAIVNKTDKMCASVLTARPKSSSSVHHNGEQDAIIYAVSGKVVLATHPEEDEAEPKRNEMTPGDFAFVPAWTEHKLLNESDETAVLVVIRSGPHPTVVNLTEWGGPEAKSARPKR